MLDQSCIPRINPTWWQYRIISITCWICFAMYFVEDFCIFMYKGYLSIVLFFLWYLCLVFFFIRELISLKELESVLFTSIFFEVLGCGFLLCCCWFIYGRSDSLCFASFTKFYTFATHSSPSFPILLKFTSFHFAFFFFLLL
jgi:hypothetical protein